MKCKDCNLWMERELPRDKRHNYPTGVCMNVSFFEKGKQQLTLPNTNCDRGKTK